MFDHDVFFAEYRRLIGRLTQPEVDGLNVLLGLIERTVETPAPVVELPLPHLAYVLATIKRETGDYHPVVERGGKSYFNRYDVRFNPRLARRLGNTQAGDGYTYRGRGYVQVTGAANYRTLTRTARDFGVDVDFARDPDLLLEPGWSWWAINYGMRMGLYTGKRLSTYIYADANGEWVRHFYRARRVVNPGELVTKPLVVRRIAKDAESFEAILRAAV